MIACTFAIGSLRRTRWQRTIFGFELPAGERPKIIVETIEGEETGLYRRPTAGLGAVDAVAHLSTVIDATRRGAFLREKRALAAPVDISLSSETLADEWCNTTHTISVGGPKSNEITRHVLAAFGCQPPPGMGVPDEELSALTGALRMAGGDGAGLGVATAGNAIYWFGTRVEGHVTLDDDHVPGCRAYRGHDYGVVLRLPSPVNPAWRLVAVFGSQTFGTAAAASWLADVKRKQTSSKVRRLLAKNRNVAVLLRTDVEHGRISRPTIVEIVVLAEEILPRNW